jgi:hypothetical protein
VYDLTEDDVEASAIVAATAGASNGFHTFEPTAIWQKADRLLARPLVRPIPVKHRPPGINFAPPGSGVSPRGSPAWQHENLRERQMQQLQQLQQEQEQERMQMQRQQVDEKMRALQREELRRKQAIQQQLAYQQAYQQQLRMQEQQQLAQVQRLRRQKAAQVGLGRIAALRDRSPSSHQIRYHIRCLYF